MKRPLIPFAGKERSHVEPLRTVLTEGYYAQVLSLWKRGLDTRSIANAMHCTEPAAANALARARDIVHENLARRG